MYVPDSILMPVIRIAGLVLAIMIHEVAHAYAALKCGDPTARDAGRITLNPVRHIDPVGSVALPAILLAVGAPFLFGWAKPVPVNIGRCRNPREAYWITAIAGPLSNLAQAVVAIAGMALIVKFAPEEGSRLAHYLFDGLLLYGITNIMLMTLNMLPIPPLDGSRVLTVLLPRNIAWQYVKLERYGFIILILLIQAKVLNDFFSAIIDGFVKLVESILSLL